MTASEESEEVSVLLDIWEIRASIASAMLAGAKALHGAVWSLPGRTSAVGHLTDHPLFGGEVTGVNFAQRTVIFSAAKAPTKRAVM